MPGGTVYFQEFIVAITNKISHKATLVNAIIDIFVIDNEVVYRRLRDEVNFSFAKTVIFARKWGISLVKTARRTNAQTPPR